MLSAALARVIVTPFSLLAPVLLGNLKLIFFFFNQSFVCFCLFAHEITSLSHGNG